MLQCYQRFTQACMKEMTDALCAKGNKLGRQKYWSGKSKTKQTHTIVIALAVYLK